MSVGLFLVIAFVLALVVGPIAGFIIGKAYVKKMQSNRRQVVSRKEALILLAVAVIGGACILYAVFSTIGQNKPNDLLDFGDEFDQQFVDQMGGIGNDMPGTVQVMPGGATPRDSEIIFEEEIVSEFEEEIEEPLTDDETASEYHAEASEPAAAPVANARANGGTGRGGNGGEAVTVIIGR